jgi:hypothetical protein
MKMYGHCTNASQEVLFKFFNPTILKFYRRRVAPRSHDGYIVPLKN